MPEILASVGPPYVVEKSGRVIRLRRADGEPEVFLLFAAADALAVADALVDLAESLN